ncbi:gamma interferon inducible lysosomal thiol reductase (GILT) domain-containing protein [Phthorimaea operculella]|nr:gamma interferon inducible lysosomal thiol reductase (GILT) domain-containing protein [Phthorimaea operculella]
MQISLSGVETNRALLPFPERSTGGNTDLTVCYANKCLFCRRPPADELFTRLSIHTTMLGKYVEETDKILTQNTKNGLMTRLQNVVEASGGEKVKLQIFYESLCGGCEDFYSGNLLFGAWVLGSALDIETYPFGNARFTDANQTKVKCQHGERECYGNKLHLCAIDEIKDTMKYIEYNSCLIRHRSNDTAADNNKLHLCAIDEIKDTMKYIEYNSCLIRHRSNDTAADNCAKACAFHVDSEAIKKCAKSQKGQDLLIAAGKETLKAGIRYTPYILLNGKEYVYDFIEYICRLFTNPPPVCRYAAGSLELFNYLTVSTIENRVRSQLDYKLYKTAFSANRQLYGKYVAEEETVKVQLYYESLCPGCIGFYTGQFYETVSKLGSALHIETFPFGNAIFTDSAQTQVQCQHGEEECYGNKLQLCAIDLLQDTMKYVEFNKCLMSSDSTDSAADSCGESMCVDSESIKKCAKSQKGQDLLIAAGKETIKAHIQYTPYTLLNGQVYPIRTDNDFFTYVCKLFTNQPPACKA